MAQLTGFAAGSRVCRTVQGRAARRLASRLDRGVVEGAVTSLAHSRNGVAAAVGWGQQLRLGIDIEWTQAARDTRALAEFLVPSVGTTVDPAGFYRLWTFAEAYFKAFQHWPPDWQLSAMAAKTTTEPALKLGERTNVLQLHEPCGFQLCLVWSSIEDLPLVPTFVGVYEV